MESNALVNTSHFWVPTISSIVIVAILLFVVSFRQIPRFFVVLIGVLLIMLSGIYFAVVDGLDILSLALGSTSEFKKQYELYAAPFVFIFPFVSAAIGTNLITDALTHHLDYKKK